MEISIQAHAAALRQQARELVFSADELDAVAAQFPHVSLYFDGQHWSAVLRILGGGVFWKLDAVRGTALDAAQAVIELAQARAAFCGLKLSSQWQVVDVSSKGLLDGCQIQWETRSKFSSILGELGLAKLEELGLVVDSRCFDRPLKATVRLARITKDRYSGGFPTRPDVVCKSQVA